MRKVLLLPALLLAALAVAALTAVAATSRSAAADAERRVREFRRSNALALRLSQLTVEEEREVLSYRFDPRPQALERMTGVDAEMDALATELGALDLSWRGRELFAKVIEARLLRAREQRQLLAAVDGGEPGAIARAYARWGLATGKAGALVADLSVFNLRRLEGAIAEIERVRSRSITLLVAVLGASAALILGFSLLVDRWLVRPVRAMTAAARRIAAAREAIPVPGGERRDELGVLARAMSQTAGELVRTNADLARSVVARDEFLSISSHELKTPLTALKLQLQSGARRWPAGDPVPPWLTSSLRQLERVEALVSELLDLARIRSGRLTLRPQPLDVGELARGVAERLRDLLARSGNRLEVDVQGGLVAEADPARLEQVLANLLVNAAHHAPGTCVRLRAVRAGDHALVSVEDEGPGIPEESRERVFDPYEKVERAQRGQGLGLGLFIARQIAEAHGGRIVAGTGGRGGARLEVAVPLRTGDGAAAAAPPSP